MRENFDGTPVSTTGERSGRSDNATGKLFQHPAKESCLERSTGWDKSAAELSSDRFRVEARPS